MRKLPRPNFDNSEVYLACVNGTNNKELNQIYIDACEDICAHASLYSDRAMRHCLFEFIANAWGNDDQVVLGQLTKVNLTDLYTKGCVDSNQGRLYYDQLMATAPWGKCPYCQFGHVETLDHFLPKARYSALSVFPENLIPSCMRCNKGKGSGLVTQENESSHPYFENDRIYNEIWLCAEITETNPVTSSFVVDCPTYWPNDLKRRVSNYFISCDLSKRYAIEAASELVSISAYLTDLQSSKLRMRHLRRVAALERLVSLNSWKAALYRALADSTWYVTVGFAGTGDT